MYYYFKWNIVKALKHTKVSEKRNLTWIDEMDNFLVDQLMEQMHKE